MWVLLFFSALVTVTIGKDNYSDVKKSKVFRKCCDINQILVKITEDDLTFIERYECFDLEQIRESYNISVLPLLLNDVRVQSGLPNYCDLQMSEVGPETKVFYSEDECYDRLGVEVFNGTLKESTPMTVALSCNRSDELNAPLSNLEINKIIKCCPEGQVYDSQYHVCIKNAITAADLMQNININGRYIYEVEFGSRCKFDEYAVEISEDLFSFSINGSNLRTKSTVDGQERTLLRGEWCIDQQFGRSGLLAQVCTRECSDFTAFCVKKCCPQGQHFKVRRCGSYISVCVPDEDHSTYFDISPYTNPIREKQENLLDVVGVGVGITCPAGRFALNKSLPQDYHELTSDAYLEYGLTITKSYCLEIFDSRHCPSKELVISGVMCFQPPPEYMDKDFRASFVVITISSVCLALTVIVYCALPELRNLNGRNLICHVSTMLLAFSCLARVQHSAVTDTQICTLLGYGIYFGFVGAFAWLNVMCFDIWWTFGSVRTVKLLHKSASERRRFLWYSIYAWGTTFLLTLTMFLLDKYPVSIYLDANIGTGACWFGSEQNTQFDWPHYIYFVIPMGIVTFINFVFWLLTARYCAKVKSEVHRLQAGSVGDRAKKRFRIDRAKYVLTGKLWVVMGAGWVSEMLSTLVSRPQWLWNIVDLMNALQGVLIFVILVVKPKLYYIIRKRLGLDKADAQKNATASGRTSSTFLSRTISSDERTNLRISGLGTKQL
ncbi:unnamed protein product [Leptosia nina]|uniref:G-protein coupled receptors family 2 profile 2 domain-containing protein n=1 Tax=Leptosia nina TaxID=320188 RepID=A0AAV1JKJ7_9NEOP